jgi:hypothetical protein
LLGLAGGGLWCLTPSARAQDVSSTWQGNTANWSTPSEWSPSDFYPNNGNGGNTFDATINGGTATLTEAIAVRNLTMIGGTIAGAFDLGLTGDMTWSGGTLSGSGTLSTLSGHTLSQSIDTALGGGRILSNAGTMNIDGQIGTGFGGTTIVNTGNLNFAGLIFEGSLGPNYAYYVTNSGTMTLADGSNFQSYGPAYGSTSSVTNTGTIQKIAGTGTATVSASVDNTGGTINVQSGAISLSGGGTIAGTLTASAGAAINFSGGAYILGTSTINGAGTISLTGGTLALSGTPDLTGLNLTGGTVSGDFSQAGNFSIAGITLSGNVAVGGNFNLTGGTLTGTVTPVGDFNWTGGTISGGGTQTNAVGHTLNQSGSTGLAGGRTLNNAGTMNIDGQIGTRFGGTTIVNTGNLNFTGLIFEDGLGPNYAYTVTNSGTMTLADGSNFQSFGPAYGSTSSVTNTGTIQKIAGTGTATIGASLDNTNGTINAQSGIVSFGQAFSNAGVLRGSGTFAGATVTNLLGGIIAPGNSPGTLTFASGLTLDDGSILNFDLGTVSDAINVSGGTLTGSASVGGITLNVTPGTGFGAGSYYLLYGNSFANFEATDFVIGTAPSGFDYAFSFDGSALSLNVMASAVPEPGTWTVFAGLAALIAVAGRSVSRKKSAAAGL